MRQTVSLVFLGFPKKCRRMTVLSKTRSKEQFLAWRAEQNPVPNFSGQFLISAKNRETLNVPSYVGKLRHFATATELSHMSSNLRDVGIDRQLKRRRMSQGLA